MKLMKINNLETAFILIWFTIASVNCQQCISKSFNITTTIVSVDRTDISIAYNIYLMVSTDNTTEYAKNCLKNVN